ncbi:MAG: putative baseplate assembly protein [Deltaproteobacteria bacterium]|nr:putative baseplate assembly protein [Deltaproteobacteria bacterium]
MNLTKNPAHDGFDDCGCCEGLTTVTPVAINNQPGLKAIAYRVGKHADFKKSLLASLSTSSLAGLSRLTSRDEDDFAIALLDAWAVVADILTFYQERLANESYLHTATENLSVFELARLVGYRPKPGVAASTLLAFTLEESPGLAPGTIPSVQVQTVPTATSIDTGTQVRSIPGPEEQSQTYETVEKIEARAEWHAIKPRLTQPQVIHGFTTRIFCEGTTTLLKPGDGLLLFPAGASIPMFREVAEVIPRPEEKYTEVLLEPLTVEQVDFIKEMAPQYFTTPVESVMYSGTTSKGGGNNPHKKAVNQDHGVGQKAQGGNTPSMTDGNPSSGSAGSPRVLALRVRAAIFGHNAPDWNSLPNFQKFGEWTYTEEKTWDFVDGVYAGRDTSWAETTLDKYHGEAAGSKNIFLDNTYHSITNESWIVLQGKKASRAYQVADSSELSKADFTLNAKVTRLSLTSTEDLDKFDIRTTTVLAQSEALALARQPVQTPVSDKTIDLNGAVAGLFKGQKIILGGKIDAASQDITYESGVINKSEVVPPENYTRITLEKALQHTYLRRTVTLNANVAWATQGEKVSEILGSGDGSQGFQKFILHHAPLTYVSSAKPGGVQSTLEIRVNDLLWEEVDSLYGRGPTERVYCTWTDASGQTVVQFGDGRTGVRLPTGRENIVASYRKGIGLEGLVKAKQLSLLMEQPLGVKGVTNPFAASGADDPEKLADTRQNTPLTLLTLGRVVSLQDYEDYARAFGGIGKALATWFWNGKQRGILLTVAGPKGAPVEKGETVYDNLLDSLRLAGDPFLPVWVASYRPCHFKIVAKVRVDPNLVREKIIQQVEADLRAAFSFEARQFGQPVTLSEVVATMQHVRGVLAVDVDKLSYRDTHGSTCLGSQLEGKQQQVIGPSPDNSQESMLADLLIKQPRSYLTAALPRLGVNNTLIGAELLTLEPDPLELGVMP